MCSRSPPPPTASRARATGQLTAASPSSTRPATPAPASGTSPGQRVLQTAPEPEGAGGGGHRERFQPRALEGAPEAVRAEVDPVAGEVEVVPARAEPAGLGPGEVRDGDEHEAAGAKRGPGEPQVGHRVGDVLERVLERHRVVGRRSEPGFGQHPDRDLEAALAGRGGRGRGGLDAGHVPATGDQPRAQVPAPAAHVHRPSRRHAGERGEGRAAKGPPARPGVDGPRGHRGEAGCRLVGRVPGRVERGELAARDLRERQARAAGRAARHGELARGAEEAVVAVDRGLTEGGFAAAAPRRALVVLGRHRASTVAPRRGGPIRAAV